MWLICFHAHSPQNSVAAGIFSHSPTPSITALGKPIECTQGRWHRFSHWADLVLSSSWKQATWPGESLLISLNIIFLCVPWGDVRFRLIRDNLSKMASMQEACNTWWLLMNVLAWQHGPFSFAFPVHFPSCSWNKHQFEDGPVLFSHWLISPCSFGEKGTFYLSLYPTALRNAASQGW